MFFKKKSRKDEMKCDKCRSELSKDYSFCPYCGNTLMDFSKQNKDYGLLGKNDSLDDSMFKQAVAENNLTITDKMISALVGSLMKNLDQQVKEMDKSELGGAQRGIKIKIGLPGNPQKKNPKHDFSQKRITEEQLKKMSNLPRSTAKTNVKRIGDKLIYELDAPGVESVKDVFVSKLEVGYEIKAIGDRKVYVNSLPVTLPITSFAINKEKLFLEFSNYN